MKKRRADERLYEELNLESLSLARALIMEGRAFAGERKLKSPGELVSEKEAMRVRGALDRYVSRGAHKLKKALEVFSIDVAGEVCVDVGASTGGFTDVLLRAGARHVYAVDVGYNLLDYRLRADARVTAMERVNARFLRPEDFSTRPTFGATDVSFISLKAVLPAALSVLDGPHRRFVALVKPQFEARREQVGKGGISDTLIKQVDDALRARELIKMRVLETAPAFAREIAHELAEQTGSEVVQVIGTRFVLYRRNPKEPKIVL